MNAFSHDHDDQQHRLDLLVDGELSDAERRQLLASLDEQPGGWRRCALAFLEAQSWGQDLQQLVRPASVPPAAHQPAPLPSAPFSSAPFSSAPQPKRLPQPLWRSHALAGWRSRNMGSLLALAASVLLCFGLGFQTHDWWHAGKLGGLPGGEPSQGFHSAAGGGMAAGARAGKSRSTSFDRLPWGGSPMNQVTLVLDDAQAADAAAVEIPIVGQRSSAGNLLGATAPVPADVLQALERLGSRVRQHQQLIPVRLDDGREAIVPMNRIELEPVNLRDYQ